MNILNTLVEILATMFCKTVNLIILLAALINLVVYFRAKKTIKVADNMLYPPNNIVDGVRAPMSLDSKSISKLRDMRKKIVQKYAWYANLTAIFPLLGILGTVASLVTYSDVNMMDNFMVALGSTLLGVFFAIGFKFFDATLSAPIDVFIDAADHVIHDYERKEAQK